MTLTELLDALTIAASPDDEVVISCEVTSSYKHPILMVRRDDAGRIVITSRDGVDITE
jgi:hypothetical protein